MMQDIRNKRLEGLIVALTEAKSVELREARALVDTAAAHKAQEATWKAANEGINVAQKALDAFISEETKRDAKELDDEWRQD